MISLRLRPAPGGPGIEPRWSRGAKEAVGTAYSTSSPVWYTISAGCLNEVYYPTVDRPQLRDFQFLITDGKTFFQDERRHLTSKIECLAGSALGFKITNSDPSGRYRICKHIIGDPHQTSVLTQVTLEGETAFLRALRLFALCAPHLEVGGWENNGEVVYVSGRPILTAHKNNTWLAMAASVPFLRCSCGYVGVNDGWQDLADNYQMDWEYDHALGGNIALTAEIDLSKGYDFTIALGFGQSRHDAVSTVFQSLSTPFATICQTFVKQWERTTKRVQSIRSDLLESPSSLVSKSANLLLAHEDKHYPGAMIASLSIPWGEEKGDEEMGGYHLVWTRDMVSSATGLLALGDLTTPLRALIYLAVSQRDDGGFYQNFWVDGEPYWRGIQLDEVAFPIILAYRLHMLQALQSFDPYNMVVRAAGYLIREGPQTPQDRWEEASGFSPSTLAAQISALVLAGSLMRARGHLDMAEFVEQYADFLESHVEAWTVTTDGGVVPGISRHYIRINPPSSELGENSDEDPNVGYLQLTNCAPDSQSRFPAKDIIDAGFLELVRYGIRKPGDALVEDSLRVVDALLKVNTAVGPCWKRYNHDGYGQRSDGSAYQGWGVGRPWPLLTGERGHYELAAGRPAEPYLRAMEAFAHGIGLIPEQIWDQVDIPKKLLNYGRATGAAIPLLWAHAEYVKLVKSYLDGRVFDLIDPVADRYLRNPARKPIEVWKFNRQIHKVKKPNLVRVITGRPFLLHWTRNEWQTVEDSPSQAIGPGAYLDIVVDRAQVAPLRFTFYWTKENRWCGKDYMIEVH